MTFENQMQDSIEPVVSSHASHTTPAGLQANTGLRRRRLLVFTLNFSSWLFMMVWAGNLLGANGYTGLDGVLLACLGLALPWSLMGFWNTILGFWKLYVSKNGLNDVAPFLTQATESNAVSARVAIVMTVRNEAPEPAIRRLALVKQSIDRTGFGERFDYYLLSDTDDVDIAALEERAYTAWLAALPTGETRRVHYRRRHSNAGFKAGNLRAFCDVHGHAYDFMLPLDADSLMTGDAVVRMVRTMQAHPKIGILQSLVVGMPSRSPFARLFQFGMRHGMRSYTMGQAWWTADCGPYWGHNALVRIVPFVSQCGLPKLPGGPPLGGDILSHDQVEAALMRKAGYEVRVMPVEDGSYEDNPPNALAFAARDQRWCQGNLQYIRLLQLPGLMALSRMQLVWAVWMFISIAACTFGLALLPIEATSLAASGVFDAQSAKYFLFAYVGLSLSPKLGAMVDTLLKRDELARFGGANRYITGMAAETIFSFLLSAANSIRMTIFMIALLFGKSATWNGQRREIGEVTWRDALQVYWPATLFGVYFHGAMLLAAPTALLWLLPLTVGSLLAVPLAVYSASPVLGSWMQRHGWLGIPEDFAPPTEIVELEAATAAA